MKHLFVKGALCPRLFAILVLFLFNTMGAQAQEGFACPCEGPGAINIDAGEGTNISAFLTQTTTTNTCMAIRGRLIINVPRTINGGEIRMQPGAEIIVNKTLILNNIHENIGGGIHGCGTMWRWIRIAPRPNVGLPDFGARLEINNCSVEDGQFAVDTDSDITQFTLKVQNSLLKNNHVGVRFSGIFGGPQGGNSVFTLNFSGNHLTCEENGLLPAFDNNIDHFDQSRSYAGILSNGTSYSLTTVNEFSQMRNGILAAGGSITLDRQNFHDLTDIGVSTHTTRLTVKRSYFTNVLHYGILSREGRVTVELGTQFQLTSSLSSIFGATYHTSLNNFGIFTSDVSLLKVKDSFFLGLQNAIYGTRSPATEISGNQFDTDGGISFYDILANQEVNITDNPSIKVKTYGIRLYPSSYDSQINVFNNTMEIEYPSFFSYTTGVSGYRVGAISEGITLFAPLPYSITAGINNRSIKSNKITCGVLASGIFNAINAHGGNGTSINGNEVEITGGGTGIVVSNSPNIWIEENVVFFTMPDVSTFGIWVTNDNLNTKVICNQLFIQRGRGILFASGDCSCIDESDPTTCTQLRGNKISLINAATLNYEGLQVSTIISPQTRNGNEWSGVSPSNPSSIVQDAFYWGDISIIDQSLFTIHTNSAPYYPGKIRVEGGAPGDWFKILSGVPFTCQQLVNDPQTGFDFGDFYDYVTDDGPSTKGDGLQWIFDRGLFRKLKTNPAFNNSTALNTFFNAHTSGTVGAFQLVDEAWLAAMEMPETTKKDLVDKGELLEEKAVDQAAIFADLEAAWPDEPVNLLTQLAELNTEIKKITDDMAVLKDAFLQQRNTYLEQVLSQNAGIATSPAHEKYLQAVNHIRLQNLIAGMPPLTTSQREGLEIIAEQCVFDGGEAVSIARALLSVEISEDCNNSSLSQPESLPVATSDNEGLSIYPNPANSEVWVYLPEVTPSTQVLLYNISGELVKQIVITDSHTRIDISKLPAGLYSYQIANEKQTIASGKLSVIR